MPNTAMDLTLRRPLSRPPWRRSSPTLADSTNGHEAMDVRAIIEAGDAAALRRLLAEVPDLANAPIRWGKNDEIVTRPLHFVCDKVFDQTLAGETAARLAQALIEAGADINHQNGDPLNAAASLGATEVGLLLLDAGLDMICEGSSAKRCSTGLRRLATPLWFSVSSRRARRRISPTRSGTPHPSVGHSTDGMNRRRREITDGIARWSYTWFVLARS